MPSEYEQRADPLQVSREDQAHHLLGRRAAAEVHLLHQCAGYQPYDGRGTLPQSLADRTVLQVVEAASQDKKVLGRVRERREDPDIHRNNCLLYDGNREEDGNRQAYLRDATTRKCLINRENTTPPTLWKT